MVSQHSVGTAVGIHENLPIFPPVHESLNLFFGLGPKMIGKDTDNLLLTPNKLHDIFENAQLNFARFIFLQLLVGHLQYLFFLFDGVAHPPMKIATHFDISVLQLDLA